MEHKTTERYVVPKKFWRCLECEELTSGFTYQKEEEVRYCPKCDNQTKQVAEV